MRTCVGCRRRASPDELVRVVRAPDGTLRVGRTLPGRGAWLCAGSVSCRERAARRGAMARALRGPVDPADVLALSTT
ncbi:MAG: YlxR family protein [Acidimicrobiia bacterium]